MTWWFCSLVKYISGLSHQSFNAFRCTTLTALHWFNSHCSRIHCSLLKLHTVPQTGLKQLLKQNELLAFVAKHWLAGRPENVKCITHIFLHFIFSLFCIHSSFSHWLFSSFVVTNRPCRNMLYLKDAILSSLLILKYS